MKWPNYNDPFDGLYIDDTYQGICFHVHVTSYIHVWALHCPIYLETTLEDHGLSLGLNVRGFN